MDRRTALFYVPIPALTFIGTLSHDREEAIGVPIRFQGVGLALVAVAGMPGR